MLINFGTGKIGFRLKTSEIIYNNSKSRSPLALIITIITVTANRRRKVQQRRSSNKVEPKAY